MVNVYSVGSECAIKRSALGQEKKEKEGLQLAGRPNGHMHGRPRDHQIQTSDLDLSPINVSSSLKTSNATFSLLMTNLFLPDSINIPCPLVLINFITHV